MRNKKMVKKKNFLLKNYSLCWKFIKESRKFIYVITGIFFAFALIGFFVPVPDYLSKEIMKILMEILRKTDGMSTSEIIKFIFFNNVETSFIGMALGIFFGVFPLLFSAFNGYVLGFVAFLSVDSNGISVLLNLLPHGIFELPAIFIALGLGLKSGMLLFQIKKLRTFKYSLFETIRVFIFVIIPLLIIAAIIEGSLIILVK
jgi:stage II sporulation protein M